MKKIQLSALLMVILMMLTCFVACGDQTVETKSETQTEKATETEKVTETEKSTET